MTSPLYVVGHKSPDTDAIVSAIGYAELKRSLGVENAVPARLGELMPETSYVLERFGVPKPVLLHDVRTRVRDVMNPEPKSLLTTATMHDAGPVMRDKRVVPVVDEDRHLRGILTLDDVAARYLEEMDLAGGAETSISFSNLVHTLEGDLIAGEIEGQWTGHVWVGSMRADSLAQVVNEGDMVVLGDLRNAQRVALEKGAACLVIVNNSMPVDEIIQLAQERGVRIILTKYDSYRVTRLLNLSVPVSDIMRREVLTADLDDLASEAEDTLLGARVGAMPVVDEHGYLVGILSRTDLLRGRGKSVILVDHNHSTQAVDGLSQARVLEVVDHHNLGDLQTHEPILMKLEPVGSTSTIVTEMFRAAELTPKPSIAGLLAAGIISDTLLFRSPTCTDRDRSVAEWLASISKIDLEELAQSMFRANSNYENTTPEQILGSNLKVYEWGGKRVGIGQAETVNIEFFESNREAFLTGMREMKRREGWQEMLFMATDILAQNSIVFMPDEEEQALVGRAFEIPVKDKWAVLKGVVSRKKQVVPLLSREMS